MLSSCAYERLDGWPIGGIRLLWSYQRVALCANVCSLVCIEHIYLTIEYSGCCRNDSVRLVPPCRPSDGFDHYVHQVLASYLEARVGAKDYPLPLHQVPSTSEGSPPTTCSLHSMFSLAHELYTPGKFNFDLRRRLHYAYE